HDLPPPLFSPLPYTTLFRSGVGPTRLAHHLGAEDVDRDALDEVRTVALDALGRPAEDDVPAAGREQTDHRAGDVAAHTVVDDGDLAAQVLEPVGPAGGRVVDGEVGAARRHAGRLRGASGQSDDGGAGVPGVLDEERADAAGRRRYDDHV